MTRACGGCIQRASGHTLSTGICQLGCVNLHLSTGALLCSRTEENCLATLAQGGPQGPKELATQTFFTWRWAEGGASWEETGGSNKTGRPMFGVGCASAPPGGPVREKHKCVRLCFGALGLGSQAKRCAASAGKSFFEKTETSFFGRKEVPSCTTNFEVGGTGGGSQHAVKSGGTLVSKSGSQRIHSYSKEFQPFPKNFCWEFPKPVSRTPSESAHNQLDLAQGGSGTACQPNGWGWVAPSSSEV